VSFCQLQVLKHFFSNYFCFLFVAVLTKTRKKMFEKIKNLKPGKSLKINKNTEIYKYYAFTGVGYFENGNEKYRIKLNEKNNSIIFEPSTIAYL
jgi:hypothetical protein